MNLPTIKRGGQWALILCTLLHIQCVNAADLLSSLDEAWSQDPTLQAADKVHQISISRIAQARAPMLPDVSLNIQTNASNGQYQFGADPASGRPIHSHSQVLQLTQALYKPQLRHGLMQAQLQAVQSLAQLSQAEQDLMLRLLQAYVDVQLVQTQQSVSAAQLKTAAQQLLVAQGGRIKGTVSQPEVDEARSQHASAQAQAIESSTQWRIKRQELLKITGQPIDSTWDGLTFDYPLKHWMAQSLGEAYGALESAIPNWQEAARLQSPAVRAQMAAVEVAQRGLLKERAGHMPTLSFSASKNLNESKGNATTAQNYDSQSRATQYGLQLVVPLYTGGGTQARVGEAVSTWEKAQFDLETAQRQAETAVVTAWQNLQAAQAQLQAQTEAIEAAQSAVKGNQEGLRVGSRTALDVYKAQQQLATSQRDWQKSRYDLLLYTCRIKAVLGTLGREDFQALNTGFTVAQLSPPALYPSSFTH